MTNTIKTYIEYFRQLAVSHHLIQHVVAAESQASTTKGECRFAVFEYDEVVTKLRSAIGDGYILFVEGYTFRGKDNEAGDYRSRHQGTFLICKKTQQMNAAQKEDNMALCEEIVFDIITKIIYDSTDDGTACGCPFKNITGNDFSAEPVLNIFEGRSGWVVNFNFEQDRISDMDPARATNAAIWLP